MKKFLAVVLSLVMLVSIIPSGILTAQAASSNGFEYTTQNGEVTITGYYGMGVDITIPDKINNLPVTSIGSYAFQRTNLVSVHIPDSVTSIGYRAFYDCEELKDVYITDLEAWCGIEFGSDANPLYYAENFYIDGSLATEIEIPGSITTVPAYAFYGFKNLTSVHIPDSVTTIGAYAFHGCTRLSSVQISDSVTEIGSASFYNCSNLRNVHIPGSVTKIGSAAFFGCKEIKDIYITDLEAWCGIEFGSSGANPLSYAENLYIDGSLITEIEIPESVTTVPAYAFYGFKNLTSVHIPDSVTSVGSEAFLGCQ